MILQLQHINFFFSPEKNVLDEFSASFKLGQIYALTGANGAGKSTLVKIISGELVPQSGNMILKDKKVKFFNPKSSIREGIIRISQEYDLIGNLSIADNIYMASPNFTSQIFYDRNKSIRFAKEALSVFEIDIDVSRLVSESDVSIYPFISIAKAIVQQPKILILDETTAILNKKYTDILFSYLRKLKQAGTTIIMVTHKLDDVFTIADFVMILRNGKLILNEASSTINKPIIANAMIGHENIGNIQNQIVHFSDSTTLLTVKNMNNDVLKNISFKVNHGETIGFISKNKEELNAIVNQLFGLSHGKGLLLINNKEVIIKSPKDAINNKVGYVTDDKNISGLFYNMTVSDNLNFLHLLKKSRLGILLQKDLNKNALLKIKQFNINTVSTLQPIVELSGGNQQRVLFGKWLSDDFDLIILNEPTAGIDIKGKFEIYKLVNKLKSNGKSFILISSEWSEIESICDKLLIVENGSILKEYARYEFNERVVYEHTYY